MPEDGKKAAIGLGIVAGIGALIYAVTRAKAAPPPPPPGLANLYGKVTDAVTGRAIAGALVTLDTHSTYTNSSGYYQLINLEPGAYALQFSKEGYQTEVR